MTRFAAPIAEQIWDMKYRLKAADGTPVDATVEDTWRRIARALAAVEADPQPWERPLLRGAGGFPVPARRPHHRRAPAPARTVTLFNCFVMGTIPDNMGGIFDALKEAALTMQQGGGIGYDFSTIRPKGAEVKGVAADASGPLSLHGRLGRDVPHHHVGRLAPRRDDGDDALRPSRYRGLHRRQARPGPPAHVQPLGAGHRRLHGGGQGRRRLGAGLRRQGLPHRCRRATCGTGSCARPTITPSRA